MPRLFSSKVILFLLFVVSLDMWFVPWIRGGLARPILSYLFVPYAAVQWHWSKSLAASLMLGLVRDLLSIQLFGAEMLALFLAALVLNFFIQKMSAHSAVLKLFATFLFVFSAALGIFLVHLICGSPLPFAWTQISFCFATAIWTTLAMPVVFFLAHRWFREDFRYSHRAL